MYETQVFFQNSVNRMGRDMFVVQNRFGKRYILNPDLKTFTELDNENLSSVVTAYLDLDVYNALVKTILNNHKAESASYTEGKLEATEKHLDDLQAIVFKNYPVKNIMEVQNKVE